MNSILNKLILFLLFLFLITSCRKKRIKLTDPDYTNFKILKLTVWKMPLKDKGNEDWDIFDGPDVFFNMEDQGGHELFSNTESRYIDVTSSDLPLNWDFVPAYEITNIEAVQFVTVYDYDPLSANDEIGYVGFTLKEHKDGYPKTITKTQNDITITLIGEWY